MKGTDAAIMPNDKIIIWLTAVFQIDLRIARASGEVAKSEKFAALALTTEWPLRPEICLRTSAIIVLMVMVCPMEIAIALFNSYFIVVSACVQFTYPPS